MDQTVQLSIVNPKLKTNGSLKIQVEEKREVSSDTALVKLKGEL